MAAPSAPPPPRRVVLLSPGTPFLAKLAAAMVARGVAADAVLLYAPAPPRGGPLRPRVRFALLQPLRLVRRWFRVRVRVRRRFAAAAPRLVLTGPLNGKRMRRDLARLAPDVVVLARCSLVSPEVLAIPREGVVNVHPGLLPWVRGSSPVAHSMLRSVPLGSTAFRVDAGIDTGAVLERRLLPVVGGEEPAALRDALQDLWVEMTVDAVAAARCAPLPPGAVQPRRLPLCRAATEDELTAGDEAIRLGAARELFDRWRPACDARLALPPDHDPLPDA